MSKPQALIEQVRSSVAVELERRHAPTLLADRKAAKAAKHKAKHHKYTKAAFFRYCYYDPAFKFFCEQVLDVDYLPLPEATRAASEVGVQNSSDYVCTPFKHILGDFAEALDLGADNLIQFGGPCRLGYYGELQESILRDMGYEFIMMNFARGIELGYIGWAKEVLKTVNPNIDVPHGVVKLKAVAKMIEHLDSLRDFYLANAGFEVERGAFAAAQEIARILRVPAAFSVESFARGTVELIGFQITEQDGMAGKSLIEYNKLHPNALLLCAAKRGCEVLVPNGHFVPQAGDRVYAIGTPTETARVLRSMGRDTSPIRQLSVIGGGRIALYLAWALDGMGMHITIVEQNEEKCMAIAEKLPKATILHGDGTDHDLLESEGIFDADAFVSLTGRDEENLLMALTAKDSGVAKVLPKMSRPNYTALVHDLGIDTVISPKDVTASQISSYVRGLANSQGSAVESLHKILGGAMEAVEFTATGATHFLNTPLKDLNFKPGLLVAAIVHGGKLLIPGGHSIISEGDRVIVVAKSLFLKDLNDILVR